jgi:hypothetical protein
MIKGETKMLKKLTNLFGLAIILTIIAVSLTACWGVKGRYDYDRAERIITFKSDATEEQITAALAELDFGVEYEEGEMTYKKTTPKTDNMEQWIELKKKGEGKAYSKYEETENTSEFTWKKEGNKIIMTTEDGENALEFTLNGKELYMDDSHNLENYDFGEYTESYIDRMIFQNDFGCLPATKPECPLM